MNNAYAIIQKCCENLDLKLSITELAKIVAEENLSADALLGVSRIFSYLSENKERTLIQDILDKSRLPKTEIKTFDNFDFSLFTKQDAEKLNTLRSLATLYSGANIAFVGPPGTGKTHLAQAYGYECASKGIKVYFIKAAELVDKFNRARHYGSVANCKNALIRYPCLIIDEIGHCDFDKENTKLFFDIVDRRYKKEGAFNTIFTSNQQPSQWKKCFEETDTLLCALDRIFDNAIVINLKGKSYRGKQLKVMNIEVGRTIPVRTE